MARLWRATASDRRGTADTQRSEHEEQRFYNGADRATRWLIDVAFWEQQVEYRVKEVASSRADTRRCLALATRRHPRENTLLAFWHCEDSAFGLHRGALSSMWADMCRSNSETRPHGGVAEHHTQVAENYEQESGWLETRADFLEDTLLSDG